MRWILVLLTWFCLAALAGCTSYGSDLPAPSENTTTPDDPITPNTPGPYVCDGLCVATAPATYTGPSLFWLGLPSLVPDCPAETPYQGLEGYVDGPMLPLFARECRITPSDSCAEEGYTCAPLPEENFHVCIHHDNVSPCPTDYPYTSPMAELESQMPVTLCCKEQSGAA